MKFKKGDLIQIAYSNGPVYKVLDTYLDKRDNSIELLDIICISGVYNSRIYRGIFINQLELIDSNIRISSKHPLTKIFI